MLRVLQEELPDDEKREGENSVFTPEQIQQILRDARLNVCGLENIIFSSEEEED